MQNDLSGKTALITGASSGLGRAFAITLARAGAHVVVVARRQPLLETLVSDIAASGAQASALALDVTDAVAVSKSLGALEHLDIVVNCAGVAGRSRAIDCDEDEWRWTYDANVHGAFFVARNAAKKMIANGVGGSIINIASIAAVRPSVSATAYSSSKAAVVQMTKSLAMEWARYRIRVNALAPGFFETDLNRAYLQSENGQILMKRIPQQRFGVEQDLEGPLLLLASDASAYMTGSVLVVDGGHLVSQL